jgi:5-methylcytosine-specific restriction protein A
MPYAPARPCNHPGCPALVLDGPRCKEHTKAYVSAYNRNRGSSAQQGYDKHWVKIRKKVLERDGYICQCQECLGSGRIVPASQVDHKIPFKSLDDPLRLDMNNLQSLSAACHSKKTATQDGGFGNRRQPINSGNQT